MTQWRQRLAPLASEAPAVSVAVLFVLAGRAANWLVTMISDKINQWTLLVGMPLAMSIGAGSVSALPLDTRQSEEFFLTAAQSLFGVALLLRFRLEGARLLGTVRLDQPWGSAQLSVATHEIFVGNYQAGLFSTGLVPVGAVSTAANTAITLPAGVVVPSNIPEGQVWLCYPGWREINLPMIAAGDVL